MPIRRTLLAAVLLTAAPVRPACAQDAPADAPATAAAVSAADPRASAAPPGPMVGLHVERASSSIRGGASDAGWGLSGQVGYGVGSNVALFARLGHASLSYGAAPAESYGLDHVDLGARFAFHPAPPVARPYLEAAVSRVGMGFDEGRGEVRMRGFAFHAGLGAELPVRAGYAVDVRAAVDYGQYTDGELDGEELDPFSPRDFFGVRLLAGLAWHP